LQGGRLRRLLLLEAGRAALEVVHRVGGGGSGGGGAGGSGSASGGGNGSWVVNAHVGSVARATGVGGDTPHSTAATPPHSPQRHLHARQPLDFRLPGRRPPDQVTALGRLAVGVFELVPQFIIRPRRLTPV